MEYTVNITLRLEDVLAAHFSWKITEACNAAESGNVDLAFDLCNEMRLRPDIDDFRKAMVNLFLAHAVSYDTPEAMTFVTETLSILEAIGIGESGYSERGVSEMERQANELVLHLEMEKMELFDQGNLTDKNAQKTHGVSEQTKKEKAAEAARQIEKVLDPDYEFTDGPQRDRGRVVSLAEAEASFKEDLESYIMDCE